AFATQLVPLDDEVIAIDWEATDYSHGAFKLAQAGQEPDVQAAYYQFLDVLTPNDTGIYLAGDSMAWAGGWIEGALQTGLNAAAAAAKRVGATLPANSPLSQRKDLYNYGGTRDAGDTVSVQGRGSSGKVVETGGGLVCQIPL